MSVFANSINSNQHLNPNIFFPYKKSNIRTTRLSHVNKIFVNYWYGIYFITLRGSYNWSRIYQVSQLIKNAIRERDRETNFTPFHI
jgi:hypothetical protein